MDFSSLRYKAKEEDSTVFKHEFLNIPEIKSYDTVEGRYYLTPEGNKYPSVTTFLDHGADKTFLEEWRARVGEAEADRISQNATKRGTAVHLACENLVLNKPDPESFAGEWGGMFRQMKMILQSRVDLIYGVETGLWSNRLKLAGRTDLLCRYDGRKTVLDYKNLSSYRKKEWIENYFCQGTVYSLMLEERTGEKFEDIVILAAIEGSSYPQIFHAKRDEYLGVVAMRYKRFMAEWQRPW